MSPPAPEASATVSVTGVKLIAGPTPSSRRRGDAAWQRFLRRTWSVVGLVSLVVIAVFSYGAPLVSRFITHVGYQDQDLFARFARPGAVAHTVTHHLSGPDTVHVHRFWLGSDELGRDVLTRLAYGGRISLTVGLASVVFALIVGVGVGLVAGYFGGLVDAILMRLVDVFLSVPNVFTLILIATLVNNSETITKTSFYRNDGWLLLPIAIGIISWTGLARLVRAEVMVIRELDYVPAARISGVRTLRLIVRHILPNVMPVVLVWATLTVPTLILLEASLSYLGFGAQIPTPSWGNMLANSSQYLSSDPILVVIPGAVVLLTSLAINAIGNGLQTALNPRE